MSFFLAYLAVSLFVAIHEGVGASSGFDRVLEIAQADPEMRTLTDGYRLLARIAMTAVVFVLVFVFWPVWLVVKIYGRVRG